MCVVLLLFLQLVLQLLPTLMRLLLSLMLRVLLALVFPQPQLLLRLHLEWLNHFLFILRLLDLRILPYLPPLLLPCCRLALQCRAYSFFPDLCEAQVEHLLQLLSFENLLAAVGGGAQVGCLASCWCVRETIPRDRFAHFLGYVLRSRKYTLEGTVNKRTGHLLLAVFHRYE